MTRIDRQATTRWDSLIADRSSGAHSLGLSAVRLALDSRLPVAALRNDFHRLAAAHPAMAVLANLALQIERANSRRELQRIRRTLAQSNALIARNFQSCLQQTFPRRFDLLIVTFSHSSTVLSSLAHARRRFREVLFARSLPLGEGATAAREARKIGILATLIEDRQIRQWVRRSDLVVVGADTLLPDGSMINKAGTRNLAGICSRTDKPFWVVASSLKYGIRRRGDLFQNVKGQRVRLFDVTPAPLIGVVIGEFSVKRSVHPEHRLL